MIYIVAQLAGAVAGALIVKLLLNNRQGRAVNFGAPSVGPRLDEKLGLGMLAEFIGTFILVWAIVGAAVNPRADRAWAPWPSVARWAWRVMVLGPLTGAGFNPARAFGPALVSGEWDGFGNFIFVYSLAP